MENSEEAVKLLWTGGWDSTFRLMQLLVEEKKKVRPYYLKFPSKMSGNKNIPIRRSTEMEINTMKKIKYAIIKKYDFTKELLEETIIINAESIEPNLKINESFKKLREYSYQGNQYDWLARLSKQYNINNLELSIVKGGGQYKLLDPFVEELNNRPGVWQIDKGLNPPEHLVVIFGDFSFPLLYSLKEETIKYVKKNKWMHIMQKTWFCHRPIFGVYPCGSCNPCIYTHKHNMAWRLPLFARLFGQKIKLIYNSKAIIKVRNLYWK